LEKKRGGDNKKESEFTHLEGKDPLAKKMDGPSWEGRRELEDAFKGGERAG